MQTSKSRVGIFVIALLAVVALAAGTTAVAADSPASPDPTRLIIEQRGNEFVLNVPVSRLSLSFPREGMIQKAPSSTEVSNQHPRYFMFSHETSGTILTGWIESAESYKGFDAFWKAELGSLSRVPQIKPRNVRTGKVGEWEIAAYDVNLPIKGASNTHLRAEWVSMGTWIDIHVSVTNTESIEAARARALKLLESLRVAEKAPPSPTQE
ncbi:MAG: hypothetical protein J0M09_05505 [Xanthomonadales bacterium]|nr:hypothetical protein [Xanthomonadales bacterium]